MLTSIKVFTGNTITAGQPIGITLNKVQGVLEKGVKYSLQFKVINYSSINTLNYIYVGTQKISNIDISQGTVIDTVDGKEVRLCSVEFTASSKVTNPVIKIGRNMVSSDTSNTLMYELTDFQLERGYKTDYSPNSNDLQIVKTDLESKINQLADSLQFYVAKNDFDNLGNTVSSALGQIEVSTGEISLKVEQTDIDNAKNELEGSIDKKISNAKAEIKMTTDSISQRVSSTESTTSTLSTKVTTIEGVANTANSKVDNLQVGGTNLAHQSNITYGYLHSANGNEQITSSLNSNKDYFGIDYIPVRAGDIFTITSYNSSSSIRGYIGVIVYNTSKVYVATNTIENTVNSATPVSKTFTIASDGYIRYTARGFGELKVKLEKGNKATDWSPAPEDVQGDIDTAQTTANSANTLANTANNTANTNKTNITTLQNTVTTTNNKVAELTTSLDSITQRVSSNETTTSTLTTTIESVKTTANNANTNASNALDKANTASTNASNAVTTANKANTTASTASTNATTAINTANSAKDTASSASTKADGAVSTANTAKSTADKAQTTANSANTLANTANNTANTNKNNITTLQTTVTTTNNKVAELTTNLDGITQRVASTESTLTTTNSKIDNLQIGGTNLLLAVNIKQGNLSGTEGTEIVGANNFFRTKNYIGVSGNTDYHIKINKPSGATCMVEKIICYTNNGTYIKQIILNTTSSVITTPSNCTFIKAVFIIDGGVEDTLVNLFRIKLEKGNRPTDWTPAPEDVDASIASVDSKVQTTNNKVASIETNLNGITQRVSSTESTVSSHTTQLGTVDTRINNAKNSAISTASSDATTKANNALASAKTDATTKANNALADAKTYTNGQITTVNTTINNKVAEIKATTDAITQRVSSTETTLTNTTNKIDNLQVGGTNLFLGGYFGTYHPYQTLSSQIGSKEVTLKWVSSYSGVTVALSNNDFQPKGEYTVSGYIKVNNATPSSKYFTGYACSYGSNLKENYYDSSTGYFRITQTYPGNTPWILHGETTRKAGSTDTVTLSKLKFEKGNKATDWSPAPQDMETTVSSLTTRVNTAEQKITDSAIVSTVTSSQTYKNGLNGKVSTNQVISSINQTAEAIKISANKLDLTGELDLQGRFKCWKSKSDKTGNYLHMDGAMMYGYNKTGGSKPVFASGLWTDENMGYFSVGYTNALTTDANGCLWMSPQHGNAGCRLTFSRLVNSTMRTTNLYFQKDGAIDFSTNLRGANDTDDVYTYRFDSGVSTKSLRCDNLRTYRITPRSSGTYDIGRPTMRYRDIFADSMSTTNNQLRLGTVKSDGSWQTYGALDINSSTGYIFPHKGNGQLSLGTTGNRFHGIYLVNSPNVSSDERLKTDIHYLDEPMPEEPTILDGRVERNMKITTKDMYDFVKDDLKLASYRYNLNLERGNTSTDYGFIAQDILYTKVGSELIQLEDKEDLNSTLSYNQGNYISTIVGALQEAINKIEVLEKKVQELESKLV